LTLTAQLQPLEKASVVTGGFAMNIVANSYYVKKLPDVNFFFEPIADDTGNSIGAAIFVYKQITNTQENLGLKDTFFHGHLYPLNNVCGKDVEISDVVELILQHKISSSLSRLCRIWTTCIR